MKKVYLLIILLHTAFISKAQFFHEDFSGISLDNNIAWPSFKWTVNAYGTCGADFFFLTVDSSWECETPSGISTGTLVYPGLTNGCVKGTFYCDDVNNDTWVTSPWVNCSGQSQVLLTFANLRANCGGSFRLKIYDSTTHYSIYLANPPALNIVHDTIDISAFAANKSKVAVEFYLEWSGGGVQQFDYYRSTWIVDDVSLYNPLCNINNQVAANGIYNEQIGEYTFCSGDSIMLNIVSPNNGQTYQWYKNGTAFTGATDSVFFTADSGLYSCMITDTCGYVFTQTLNVKPVPFIAITPQISCLGDLVYCPPNTHKEIFAGSSTDPYTYQWFNNGVLIPNETNYSLICNQFTPYYAIVTTACASYSTDTVILTQGVAPVASITGVYPFPRCYPQYSTMVAFDSTGYSFQWKKNGFYLSGFTDDTLSTALYSNWFCSCVVTDTYGCTQESNTLYTGSGPHHSASMLPSGSVAICTGDTVQLVANFNSPLYSYQWLNNNTSIPFANQRIYNATQPGTYNIYITNNTCTSLSDSAIVYIPCIGSNDIPPPEARIANPFNNNFTVQLANNNLSINGKEVIQNIAMYNSLGKLISTNKIFGNNYSYNTQFLTPGIYLLHVQTEKDFYYVKFVVTRNR